MATPLGEQFAHALVRQDAGALKQLVAPAVDFRALTPGRFWEAADAGVVVDEMVLGTWFTPDRRITRLTELETDEVGDVERVRYRFDVTRPDGDFVVEQQAYYRAQAGEITWLRIICTGFLPAMTAAGAEAAARP
jgi:hypothetical protein